MTVLVSFGQYGKKIILAEWETQILMIFCDLTGSYLFKVNNGNTGTMCEIRSKLTMKTLE